MRIALIGMSGTGKSYWSHRLIRTGFERLGCDDHIGRELARQLALGDASIEAIGQWMGFPYEDGFAEREARYLELEHHVLSGFVNALDQRPDPDAPSFVIDTTGSVIYLAEQLLERLRRVAVVVYLAAAPDKRERLLTAYLNNPRPVVWRGYFRRNPGENTAAALARCYMELLGDRDCRYRRWAHLTVELPTPGPATTPDAAENLLEPVRAYLKEKNRAATL